MLAKQMSFDFRPYFQDSMLGGQLQPELSPTPWGSLDAWQVALVEADFMKTYCTCDDNSKITPLLIASEGKKRHRPLRTKKRLLIEDKKLEDKIDLLMSHLENSLSGEYLVRGRKKAENRGGSDRRSTFIGVSKNGPSWQALISIRKKKTYIGTYETELEAAQAFDFNLILLNGLAAKTNFSYTKEDIVAMVQNYKDHGNRYVPPAQF